MDIGFALNYQYIFEVNVTPGSPKKTWAWVGPGITSISPDNSETTSDDSYYSDGGNTKTSVTGVSKKYSVEGHRLIGDPFQDFVAAIEDLVGSDRETQYRITDPTGRVVEADCVITDVAAIGPNGNANEKQSFACSISRAGLSAVIEDAKGTILPDSISSTDITIAKVGDTAAISTTVTPNTASGRCLFAVEDTEIATVDADGIVTAKKEGTTRIAIKAASKPAVNTVITLTVGATA